MKTKIKQGFLSFPLALVLIFGAFALCSNLTVSAATYSGECGASLTWELDTDTGVLTISGEGAMTHWLNYANAPWYNYITSIKTITLLDGVTSIGDNAFYHCTRLASVEIPDSVTSIGSGAFSGCNSLTSVVIPDNVTSVGDFAFYNCTSLASVEIPDSVTSIGDWVFYCCSSLTSVEIPNNVTSIGSSAFAGCTSLANVEIPNRVTSIGSSAFAGCTRFTSVEIPNSVTSIEIYAFAGCTSLANVEIPDSVTSIVSGAFISCTSLESVNVHTDNLHYMSENGVLYNKNQTTLLCYPEAITDTLAIPNSVTSIGDFVFFNYTSLTSAVMVIPDSVTSIGYSAFGNCTSLASIAMPDSVTFVGDFAFENCTSLASVVILDSVTSIGSGAFSGCKALDEVYFISAEPPTVGYGAFSNVKSGARAIVPENWENAGIEEGSSWNGLIVVYGEYTEPTPKECEYCHAEIINGICDCVEFSGGLKGDGKGKLGEIVTESTGDNKIYIKGKANGTTLSDVTDGSSKVNVYEIVDGKEVPVTGDDTKLGTGMIMRNGAEEIIVVVTGDLTGKGESDIEDAKVYLESLVGNTTLDTAQELATLGIIAGKTESAIKNLRSFLNSVMKAGT